jgi:tRNA(fMet)-specific endonuclease VapC
MIGLDTDILTELFAGNSAYQQRVAAIASNQRGVPVVAAAEVLRGWLSAIRQAEGGKGRRSLDQAYQRFQLSLELLAPFQLLPYTAAAHSRFQQWKSAKLRVGTNDMRIAAICLDHGATLITRNARDYKQIPGLTLDIWN